MSRRFAPVLLLTALTACSSEPEKTSGRLERIPCADTADCVARGGTCEAGECHADNECAADPDCAGGESCVPDGDFGGLCSPPEAPPMPLPAWACTTGKDCPEGQGCGDDGVCHLDGECTDSSTCGADRICYNAGNDDPAGFCSSSRPANDPYCRSDGLGACRLRCYTDGTCAAGSTCVGGYCHSDGECAVDDDCTPNHVCAPFADYEDYGYSICVEDPSPICVDDGAGACRLACESDGDCLHGGGCDVDGLCHASNECSSDPDCDPGLICYADPEFGGLCGAPRP